MNFSDVWETWEQLQLRNDPEGNGFSVSHSLRSQSPTPPITAA